MPPGWNPPRREHRPEPRWWEGCAEGSREPWSAVRIPLPMPTMWHFWRSWALPVLILSHGGVCCHPPRWHRSTPRAPSRCLPPLWTLSNRPRWSGSSARLPGTTRRRRGAWGLSSMRPWRTTPRAMPMCCGKASRHGLPSLNTTPAGLSSISVGSQSPWSQRSPSISATTSERVGACWPVSNASN